MCMLHIHVELLIQSFILSIISLQTVSMLMFFYTLRKTYTSGFKHFAINSRNVEKHNLQCNLSRSANAGYLFMYLESKSKFDYKYKI